jgi:phosphoribosylformimino-5-aminoimidazole carboxamide ribotide isomerase
MILLPAIDLYGGKAVRLKRGDFSLKTEYDADPCEAARAFADAGCGHLHIVDLEGAESGEPRHLEVLAEMSGIGMQLQYGGGLRSKDAVKRALGAGASKVMVGSLLFRGDEAAEELFSEFGAAIVPSVDVRDGAVVVSGWTERTALPPGPCVERFSRIGFKRFLITSVEKDGMLEGPDVGLYGEILSGVGPAAGDIEIIAAGGVAATGDIKRLKDAGVFGAVVGKALYEPRGGVRFDLAEALAICGGDN